MINKFNYNDYYKRILNKLNRMFVMHKINDYLCNKYENSKYISQCVNILRCTIK